LNVVIFIEHYSISERHLMELEKPRTRRNTRIKQAIIKSAVEIIHHEGLAALSIRRIADAIDYSPASIYEYYANKDAILQAVCEEGFAKLTVALNDYLPQTDIRVAAQECGVQYVKFAVSNPDYFLLMFSMAANQVYCDPSESLDTQLLNSPPFMVIHTHIQALIGAGYFVVTPSYGSFQIALSAWQMVHGIAMLALTMQRQGPLDYSVIRATLDAWQRGFAPHGA
jgi:AcrR family transcriptional regulator